VRGGAEGADISPAFPPRLLAGGFHSIEVSTYLVEKRLAAPATLHYLGHNINPFIRGVVDQGRPSRSRTFPPSSVPFARRLSPSSRSCTTGPPHLPPPPPPPPRLGLIRAQFPCAAPIFAAPAAAALGGEAMLEKDRISYFYDGTFTALPVLLPHSHRPLQNPSSLHSRNSHSYSSSVSQLAPRALL
jgi:hypothetical protein